MTKPDSADRSSADFRISIVSAFGDPRDRRTWSGAPANIADALEGEGIAVSGINAALNRLHYAAHAAVYLLSSYGRFTTSEAIARSPMMRRTRARRLAEEMARRGATAILHTGTLDMPPPADERGVSHFLFCDHTWNLSLKYRTDVATYTPKAVEEFDRLEREAYAHCAHIFTFGDFVRSDLIEHYGVSPDRVTAVGSGMGAIPPYSGPKDYSNGRLLFIAKHLFHEKGGDLLLDAFRIAVAKRPDLSLTIVGSNQGQTRGGSCPNVETLPFVTWEKLQSLQQEACLLVQPMLNDPWGQVYLEALISRTPVIGLNRNGLPEITGHGRYGFLVEQATPEALAGTMLDAVANPARLDAMGAAGQRHVMDNYSWPKVGRTMAAVLKDILASSAGTGGAAKGRAA